jgi:long-chain acyl-CoA synthetase
MERLGQVLAHNARKFADKPAIVEGRMELTHHALLARVSALADALGAQGARRVAVVLPSGHDVVCAHYASMIAGCEAMLLDARMPQDDLVDSLGRFQPAVVITRSPELQRLTDLLGSLVQCVLILPCAEDASFPRVKSQYAIQYLVWPDSPVWSALRDCGSLDQVALVLCTTGTTGARKLVSLTERNVLAAARNINEFTRIDESAKEVTPLPLHRSFGLGRARCLSLVGGTLIISPPRGDRALALIARHQATGFSAVPAFFRMLIATFGGRLARYFADLDYMEIGSASMEQGDKVFLIEAAPRARICMHYGSTEASRSAFIEFRSERDKLSTVGRPTPHVRLRVMSEDGTPCRNGEPGEIVVQGEHVCAGYWGDDQLTAAGLRHGWLHTSDCGSIDADGYVRLLGRMDDVMNVGGVKVSPERIESVARDIPGVADCAAVGRHDSSGIYGELPLLYVVGDGSTSLSARRIKSYCAERLLPEEVPHEVLFIDAIPRTDTGKIQRAHLRALRT